LARAAALRWRGRIVWGLRQGPLKDSAAADTQAGQADAAARQGLAGAAPGEGTREAGSEGDQGDLVRKAAREALPDLQDQEAALDSVRLDEQEVQFLASPAIGAIANKSPRAVKRLSERG
jgi:hypothetical protein